MSSNIQPHPILSAADFRTRRYYLPEEAFALVTGEFPPPTDPMPEKQWQGIMNNPTDVLLRTSDHQGKPLAQLYDLWRLWVHTMALEPDQAPFMFNAALDAADDFQAATFSAAHGYYRQGMASLRSALETLTISAGYAVRQDRQGLRKWLDGHVEPKFGNAREFLVAYPRLRPLERAIGGAGLFGRRPDGVLLKLYRELSGYIHSQASATNGAIWQSNGPVWVPEAFDQFYAAFRDVMAMGCVLLAIGWPEVSLREAVWLLFDRPGGPWAEVSTDAIRSHFIATDEASNA
jgi:hypothetical protein